MKCKRPASAKWMRGRDAWIVGPQESFSAHLGSLQPEALGVLDRSREQPPQLGPVRVLGQQQQIEARLRCWQPIDGLAAAPLDLQGQPLEAAHRRQVAARDELEELPLLYDVERGDDLPKLVQVAWSERDSPIDDRRALAQLIEVQILLAAHDGLKVRRRQAPVHGRRADAVEAVRKGGEELLDAGCEVPFLEGLGELAPAREAHRRRAVLALKEMYSSGLAKRLETNAEVQAERVLEGLVGLLRRQASRRLPPQDRLQRHRLRREGHAEVVHGRLHALQLLEQHWREVDVQAWQVVVHRQADD
mmetsp:Transcript_85393/g.261152  ORF Transcript_85393/g.261152 Transcript_85393/m.261152 type:complete len:304 (-) Transcript_85393:584-1495(-)